MTRQVRPAIASAVALLLVASSAAAQGLTGEPQLRRVYDAIFDARMDEVPQLLNRACPPAPREACRVLEAVSTWWRIQLDPQSRTRDAQFQSQAYAAIAATEAWTKREPQRAEAWFYVGGAYGARAQWRVLRGEHLGAARDGKQIKDALEKALALDPALHEAYFGIGLYHYYAAVAPAAAKVLRWLLFLPGGDRVEGMKEMLTARADGEIIRDEADYQLHVIYLWYEQQPLKALDLLMGLRRRHPRNPLFPQLIAEVQDVYFHDAAASLGTWQSLLDAAGARGVAFPALAETRARLGMAKQLERLSRIDAATEQLRLVIAARPVAPAGAIEHAQRELARLVDRSPRPRD